MQTNLQPAQSCERESPNRSEPHYTFVMRGLGGGRVSLSLDALVSPETAASIKAVIDKEDQQSGESLSIDILAAELDVSRRTIERAMKDGVLVPTRYKGARARFSREYVGRLKERAQEARSRGIKHVIGVAAAAGPIVGAVRVQRTQKSAAQWARATLWKRKHTPRTSPRPKESDIPDKRRPVRIVTRAY